MKTIETTGILNGNKILINKKFGKQYLNKSVKIVIMLPEENEKIEDIDNKLWLKTLSNNSSFDFLNDIEENIYSLTDGKIFKDEV